MTTHWGNAAQQIISTACEIRRIKTELHRLLSEDVKKAPVAVGGRVGVAELRWALAAMDDAAKRYAELEQEWQTKWSNVDGAPTFTQIINEQV